MAVDNRLTCEQLAALVPGDRVTIELVRDFRRPRHVAATVVRVTRCSIMVSCCSDRGVRYVHEFGLRDGARVGGGGRAELVAADAHELTSTEQRRQSARVNAAYREWARNRADVDRLRQLRDAIDDCLKEQLTSVDASP